MDNSTNSPDPLTLPSSPLAARFRSTPRPKPLTTRSHNSHSSPSKSFIMETGKGEGASPWRIKVTVEAEPSTGSPRKRAVKVPLKASSSPSIPASRRNVRAHEEENGGETEEQEVKRPQRKRKGTPIRQRWAGGRTRAGRMEGATTDGQDERTSLVPAPTSTSKQLSSATKRHRRKSLQTMPTQRSAQLNLAREELDRALRDAVGYEGSDGDEEGSDRDMSDGADHVRGVDETFMNEDFTMVSIDTLQSLKADTSHVSLGEIARDSVAHVGEKSGLSVSYLPSSPPKENLYPDLEEEAREARESMGVVGGEEEMVDADDEVEATVGAEQEDADEEEDIWQEEASHSLEEEQHPPVDGPHTVNATTATSQDVLAEQPIKPRRSKIPRTWRRTSGIDFPYSDSPAHTAADPESRKEKERKRDASTDGGGSRASSGVLTPPSTDDEHHHHSAHLTRTSTLTKAATEQEDFEGDFTHPDAAGTHLHHNLAPSPFARNDVISPSSDSSSSLTSPDGEDTGLFWQNNLPSVYSRHGPSTSIQTAARRVRPRPRMPERRQRAMDLSELLNLKDSSPAKVQVEEGEETKHSPLRMQPVQGRIKSSPSEVGRSRVVSSPLRRSLLRSSKVVGGSPLGNGRGGVRGIVRCDEEVTDGGEEGLEKEAEDSFQSKASDQRQLLAEMAAQPAALDLSTGVYDGTSLSEERSDDYDHVEAFEERSSYDEKEYTDDYSSSHIAKEGAVQDAEETLEESNASHSYEEHLNLDSPQKIRVNFNDSQHSSLLAPRREYAPLFASNQAASRIPQASPRTITIVSKHNPRTHSTSQQTDPGILTRLTTTFWSAVVRPTGPTSLIPPEEPTYPPTLRAHLRSRYGVLPSSHPWTMTHMRTLHRMHNSCTSQKRDSIIPRSGALPTYLSTLINTTQTSISGYKYTFTTQHAHVVAAFLQVLVPKDVVEAMERGEVDMLGDATAREYRGEMAGRKGRDLVYGQVLYRRKMPADGTAIGWDWVVGCLGDVVKTEDAMEN